MDSNLIMILASIFLLFLIFPFLFFVRRRAELRLEENILILEYPISTKKIELENELESWGVEKSYYIRWGVFYSVTLLLKSGKRVVVNSLLNLKNYDLLYEHLSSHFPERRRD